MSDDVEICLYPYKMVMSYEEETMELKFEEINAVTVLGRNKLNVYTGRGKDDTKIYQLKGDKRFNALKYVNLFHRYKNQIKGDEHVKFLGL